MLSKGFVRSRKQLLPKTIPHLVSGSYVVVGRAPRPVTDSHAAAVYLLDEIAELSRQSPESAQNIADAVEKKLAHKSPIVKFKVNAEAEANKACT